jgi:KaiC/GvpD/RAD55 family RecA-like ATPase
MSDELDDIIQEIDKRDEQDEATRHTVPEILRHAGSAGPRFKTGIATLDERLTPESDPSKVGLPLGRAVCINGAPGAGKSLLLNQLALEIAKQGVRVLLLVEDEPREDAAERIGQGLGFAHKELNTDYPTVLDALEKRITEAGIDLSIFPDEDVDEARLTIEQAASVLQRRPSEKGYLLALDSLHTCTCDEEVDEDPPRVRIEKRMRVVRKLRRSGILVLFTGEANRGAYANKDAALRTSALAAGAESRAIEFGADVVMLLSEGDGGSVKVEVPKNRIGRKRSPFNTMLSRPAARLVPVEDEELEANVMAMREASLLPLQDKVVALVQRSGVAMSGREIREELGGRPENVVEALRMAVSKEMLVKGKRKGAGGGFEYSIARVG